MNKQLDKDLLSVMETVIYIFWTICIFVSVYFVSNMDNEDFIFRQLSVVIGCASFVIISVTRSFYFMPKPLYNLMLAPLKWIIEHKIIIKKVRSDRK